MPRFVAKIAVDCDNIEAAVAIVSARMEENRDVTVPDFDQPGYYKSWTIEILGVDKQPIVERT